MIAPGILCQYSISTELIRIYIAHLLYIQVNTKTKNIYALSKNLESDLDYIEKYFIKLS